MTRLYTKSLRLSARRQRLMALPYKVERRRDLRPEGQKTLG